MGIEQHGKETIEHLMALFETQNQVILPDDLKTYFKSFNAVDYETDMFFFYGIEKFKSVEETVGDFRSAPDYRNIVNTLPDHADCFVFADYFIKICVYAIRLYKTTSDKNEVYVVMGDNFKVLASSFSEFLGLYKSDINNVLI